MLHAHVMSEDPRFVRRRTRHALRCAYAHACRYHRVLYKSKVVLKTVSDNVQAAAGPLQTCAGHEAGCEAAVHAMREIFTFDNTEAILLVDASNAFNAVKRQAALHNIQVVFPAISIILRNTYQVPRVH